MLPLLASAVSLAMDLGPCHPVGIAAEAKCGVLDVPLSDGGQLALDVLVLPAIRPDPAKEPLFILAGGPGQAATDLGGPFSILFQPVLRGRDLVFLDQRGTGTGGLSCPEGLFGQTEIFSPGQHPAAEGLSSCLEGLDFDPADYLTRKAAEDIERAREALGYGRIALYGVSYGSLLALEYLRIHESNVHALVLDGAVAPDVPMGQHFGEDADAALEGLFRGCSASPGCRRSFPRLREDFDTLLASLETPVSISLHHPTTHRPVEVELDRTGLLLNVRGLLYSSETSSLLPLAITQAAGGDWSPFVAQSLFLDQGVGDSFSLPLNLTISCSEAQPFYAEAGTSGYFGDLILRSQQANCEGWPRASPPPGFMGPLRSEVPALVLSGALDPVTPPGRTGTLLAGLPRAQHAVAPGAAHNVASHPCVASAIGSFLMEPGAPHDFSCIESLRRPSFFLSPAGPVGGMK
jgi:pimeloyl-ACP methyl ester carboxylesterase